MIHSLSLTKLFVKINFIILSKEIFGCNGRFSMQLQCQTPECKLSQSYKISYKFIISYCWGDSGGPM